MAESSIIKYIKDTLSQGFSESEVRSALKKQGWSDLDIDEAMKAAKPPVPAQMPKPGKTEQPKGQKDGKPAQTGQASGKSLKKGGLLLTAAGGLLILANSLLVYLGTGDVLRLIVPGLDLALLGMLGISLAETDIFLINLIIGAFLAGSSYIIYSMPSRRRITGMFIVILSMVSVLAGNGFLAGGIIALAGGALAIMDK